ncbi:hypothetical protein PITC_051060 [Penicillium italicum]|uniref:Uncharacterized protein n=1 Tax=Penicillium italicum TaxID=40296 RepID=A0A0A2KX26_PENIT|nr:hypothetical protein PITC_051060 [Penicillium italicum]
MSLSGWLLGSVERILWCFKAEDGWGPLCAFLGAGGSWDGVSEG